ncbi:probetacellulin isoform X2 [Latimeria chalumnae]
MGEEILCNEQNDNCTDANGLAERHGHFSKCPKSYKHYCIKGKCRFVVAEKAPACICEDGYTGSRCEVLDIFYLRGEREQIVVFCLIASMVALIILIILFCICAHHCRKLHMRRKKREVATALEPKTSENRDSLAKSEDTSEIPLA